jgi:hypothetical protein
VSLQYCRVLCVVVARHIVALRDIGDDVVLCGCGLEFVVENSVGAGTHHDDF